LTPGRGAPYAPLPPSAAFAFEGDAFGVARPRRWRRRAIRRPLGVASIAVTEAARASTLRAKAARADRHRQPPRRRAKPGEATQTPGPARGKAPTRAPVRARRDRRAPPRNAQ
jgi:hypothetical protein